MINEEFILAIIFVAGSHFRSACYGVIGTKQPVPPGQIRMGLECFSSPDSCKHVSENV